MSKKPALYYTLASARWHTPFGKYAVLAVTSEGPRGRLNGRYTVDDHPTHMHRRDTIGRYETLEQAEAKIAEVERIITASETEIKDAAKHLQSLFSKQREAIELCLSE